MGETIFFPSIGRAVSPGANFPTGAGLWVWNGTTQQWVLLDPSTGGGGVCNAPWDWPQGYADPLSYTSRIIAPGYNSGLTIAAGAYPPGYRISDGATVGGVFPASGAVSDGTLPIRIQPPTSGMGPLSFITECQLTVLNTGASAGTFSCVLGTTASSGASEPLYPYLGVGHENASVTALTIQPGEVMHLNCRRLDVVDNALNPGIPNWPNWTMQVDTSAGASLLYPAICPIFTNSGTVPLLVTDVFIFGFAVGGGALYSGGDMALPTTPGNYVWNGSSQLWVPLTSALVQGVTDGSNAPSGFVGEYQEAESPSAWVPLTSSAPAPAPWTLVPLTQLSLPAGDWQVGAQVMYDFGGLAYRLAGLLSTTVPPASTTPGTNIPGQFQTANLTSTYEGTGITNAGFAHYTTLTLSERRVSSAVPVTIYCSTSVVVVPSAPATDTAWARIHARRAR